MINQQGTPTFFFTLSAADTKWPDLHALIPTQCPVNLDKHHEWKIHNIISNPHITSQYIQNIPSRGASKRFSYNTFLVQVFYYFFHLILLFVFFTLYNSFLIFFVCIPCRYELQHRGSTHIHGFIWLEDAPNMDTLYQEDVVAIETTTKKIVLQLQLQEHLPSLRCPYLVHLPTK